MKSNLREIGYRDSTTDASKRPDLLRFTARGGSMYPFIRDRDAILVEPAGTSEIRLGEILVYPTTRGTAAHRLIARRRKNRQAMLICQGDRFLRPDPPVGPEEVLGRVVAISRNGKVIHMDDLRYRLLGFLMAKSLSLRWIVYPILKWIRRAEKALLARTELSPGEKLLLECARMGPDTQSRRGFMNLSGESVDWSQFLVRAVEHGTAPNIYLNLRALGGTIPGEVRQSLREMYLWNLSHNARLWSALKEIVEKFNEASLDAIPLKGVFLAQFLHGDIGLRTSSDIDLLVREDDLPRVRDKLVRMGYEPCDRAHSDTFVDSFLRHQGFFQTAPYHPPIYLEIHWNFYLKKPRAFDMSPVWGKAIPRRVGDFEFLSLSSSDTLLHLAINLRLHGYLGLKLFRDLHQLISRQGEEIEWDYVVGEAKKNGQRVGLYYALLFTKELLGLKVPEPVLRGLRPNLLRRVLVTWVLNPRRVLRPPSGSLRTLYWDLIRLVTIDSLWDGAKTLMELALFYPREMAIRHRSLWTRRVAERVLWQESVRRP